MKAFTIIEVLIVVVIFSFLAIGITGVMNLGNLTFPIDLGQVNLQHQVRQAMQWLSRELREASAVTYGADYKSVTFNSYSGSGIAYYLDASDVNGDNLTNQIIREFPAGSRRVIANDISELLFTPDTVNPLLLRVDISAGRTVMNKALTFSLAEQVRLRNE